MLQIVVSNYGMFFLNIFHNFFKISEKLLEGLGAICSKLVSKAPFKSIL